MGLNTGLGRVPVETTALCFSPVPRQVLACGQLTFLSLAVLNKTSHIRSADHRSKGSYKQYPEVAAALSGFNGKLQPKHICGCSIPHAPPPGAIYRAPDFLYRLFFKGPWITPSPTCKMAQCVRLFPYMFFPHKKHI